MRALLLSAVLVSMAVVVSTQGTSTYKPPQIVTAELPGPVSPHLLGGGEVLIEAIVDRRGMLTRPVMLRTTPPFGNLVLGVIGRWTFKPAEDVRSDNTKGPVDASVLVAAIYRVPSLLNEPAIGEPARDLAKPGAEVAFPVSIVVPPYPVNAANGFNASVVLYEVSLDEQGAIRTARAVAGDPGFDSTSRESLLQWRFRPNTYRGRPAPAVAYVLFGFPVPVLKPPYIGDPTKPAVPSQPVVPSPR